MSPELDKARAHIARLEARHSGDEKRVADAVMTKLATDANAAEAERDAALAEVDRLTAALAEAEATIANERGEGEPPAPGWTWHCGHPSGWICCDGDVDVIVYRLTHVRETWVWKRGNGIGYDGRAQTARAAMRAATLKETP